MLIDSTYICCVQYKYCSVKKPVNIGVHWLFNFGNCLKLDKTDTVAQPLLNLEHRLTPETHLAIIHLETVIYLPRLLTR